MSPFVAVRYKYEFVSFVIFPVPDSVIPPVPASIYNFEIEVPSPTVIFPPFPICIS